jgi:DNA-binding beta-propeller fold protein YncE
LELGIWSFLGAWSLGLGILATGCSTTPKPSPPPSSTLVWPAAPDTPRIAYVHSFSRPSDLGIRQSAFTRFGHWLTGSEKGNETLAKPFGLALDENDNLCLTDTGANRVSFYDRSKMKWQSWNQFGRIRLASPVAIAKSQGIFYVADSALASVLAFDSSGKLLLQITNHLERPSGLIVLNSQLFVADSRRHCIVVFDLRGKFQREFGKRGFRPGEFNFPTHLAADSQGNLLVTDSMNSRVQVVDLQGTFKGEIGKMGDSTGQFSRPKGAAVDPSGRMYVVDGIFDNVQIFDPAGRFLMPLGEAGSKAGEFWLPNGIAIRRDGEILVADSYNHRVQVFKYVGP